MFVFHIGKSATVLVRFPPTVFVCVRFDQSGFLGFRATKVKDTKLTLAVIPFQVGKNNSLNFLALQTYKNKVAEYPFLLKNITPWSAVLLSEVAYSFNM